MDDVQRDEVGDPAPEARHPVRSRTLRECWSLFMTRPSPYVIAGALFVAVAARLIVGEWTWRDAVMAGVVLASTPFVEWVIHVVVLHSPTLCIGRVRLDLPSAKEHRYHHKVPTDLDGVLIPIYVLVIFLPIIVGMSALQATVLQTVAGGEWWALAASALVASYAVLLGYEWCHFLIHSPYKPRHWYYRSIHRNHRLHHYKNEHFWFGVTSGIGDRVIGTAPDQDTVPRSPTARSLHEGDPPLPL